MSDDETSIFDRYEFTKEELEQAAEMLKKSSVRNPIKARKFDTIFDFPDAAGCPRNRAPVLAVIKEHKIPVGSSTGGYHYLRTEQDLSRYEDPMKRRVQGIESRIKKVREAWFLRKKTANASAATTQAPLEVPE